MEYNEVRVSTGVALTGGYVDYDATPQQIALAWLLHTSDVTLPIPGTYSIEHLEENVAASAIDLSDDEVRRLDDAA